MINGLHHVAIICSDEAKSLRFYQSLGFEVISRHERPERGDCIVNLSQSGITLELFIRKGMPDRVTNPEAYGLRHLALKVDDVVEVSKRLELLGYKPEEIRNDTYTHQKMTFVPDPDGLPVELHE